MNISANYYTILERLDCYVAHIAAFKVIIGGSLSKNEYS